MSRKEKFVSVMLRNFGIRSFSPGLIKFKYDGVCFPIVKTDDLGLYYGTHPWLMGRNDVQYRISDIKVVRKIVRSEITIGIVRA